MNHITYLFLIISNLNWFSSPPPILSIEYKESKEVFYKASYSKEVNLRNMKLFKEINYYYNLSLDDKKSEFYCLKEKTTFPKGIQIISYDDDDFVHKNNENQTIFIRKTISKKTHYALVKKKDLNWKISNVSRKILGFTCYEATLENIPCTWEKTFNSIKVWYSPEIPTSNGPYMFDGLPGMILRMECRNDEVLKILEATCIDYNGSFSNKIDNQLKDTIKFEELCNLVQLRHH